MTPEEAAILHSAMERARAVLCTVPPPRVELQHDAFVAAEEIGATMRWERYLADDGEMRWRAGVVTARGTSWVDVVDRVDVDDPWEYAFRELGLFD